MSFIRQFEGGLINHSLVADLSRFLQTQDWQGVASCLDDLPVESWNATAYFAKALLSAFGPAAAKNLNEAVACLETACRL